MALLGQGILKGLGVTLRHFIATYTEDLKYWGRDAETGPRYLRRQSPKAKGMVTIEYPAEKAELPENFRNIPFLVHDTTIDEIKCTSCGICSKVCPPQCIWIVRTEDPVTKRPVPQPKQFFIDSTICMNCGYCAEFCPFDAIKMNKDYEIAYFPGQVPEDRLVYDKAMLEHPDTYQAALHPTDWAREMAEKGAAAAKKGGAPAPAAKAAPSPAAKPATAPAPGAPKPAASAPPPGAPPAAKPPSAGAPPPAAKPPAAPPPPGGKPAPGAPPPASKK